MPHQEQKTELLQVRVRQPELKLLRRAARLSRTSVSDIVRRAAVLAAAMIVEQKKGGSNGGD